MRYRGLVLTLFVLVALGGGLHAQTADVEVDPITCWWRASTGFIRVGEPFSVVLTCAVVETQATKVVPDQSRLDPSVMQMPPFEVTGGAHGADVRTTARRFFQYEYQVRLVAENLFGSDATVPPLQVAYHVETRAGQGEATKGRDLTYQLPALTLRVSSLVPDVTRDIREAPGVRLSDIDGLKLRANTLRLVAGLLVAIGGLIALAALVSLFRRRRGPATEADTALSARGVLAGVRRSLQAARQESQQSGWSQELAGRALAAVRIAASYAAGRPVGQRPTVKGSTPLDGQLVMGGGWSGTSKAAVSGGATAEAISAVLNGGSSNGNQLTLEELRDSLAGLTHARFGRQDELNGSSLDEALASGLRATERLAADYTWMAEARRSVTNWTSIQTRRVWKG
jgi:hypothetical protein